MRFSKTLLKNMSKLTNITKIWFGPLPASSHLEPFRLYFHQNGCEKNWDLLKTTGHKVIVVVYNETTEKLLFIKKFRPSVYHNFVGRQFDNNQSIELEIFPPSLGETIELLSFIIDSKECHFGPIKAQLKACGYFVEAEHIEEVITFKSGVGYSTSYETLYYCKVTDDDKIPTPEKGEDDEDEEDTNEDSFEVVEYSLHQADLLFKDFRVLNCTPELLFGTLWVLNYKIRLPAKEPDQNPPAFMNEMVAD